MWLSRLFLHLYRSKTRRAGRIVLTYYAKSVNIIAGEKGEGVVFNDVGAEGAASAMSTSKILNKSLVEDLSPDGSSELTDKDYII